MERLDALDARVVKSRQPDDWQGLSRRQQFVRALFTVGAAAAVVVNLIAHGFGHFSWAGAAALGVGAGVRYGLRAASWTVRVNPGPMCERNGSPRPDRAQRFL